MAPPWTVLGHLHHTLEILVEHAAHCILLRAAEYSETSSSDADEPVLAHIWPSDGAPSVLFRLACAVVILRCCRFASFSLLSFLFFQMYEKRRTSAGRFPSNLALSRASKPQAISNCASKVAVSLSSN